jgi:FMN phosphatase YigB (HAD superfamily)
MVKNIIFDLSEVFIYGLIGVKLKVGEELGIPKEEIGDYFGGELLKAICVGDLTEDEYLSKIVEREHWQIEHQRLKEIIRGNFHIEIHGTIALLDEIPDDYHLILHSDHAREWVDYIKQVHPFLKRFQRMFFSYELKRLKKDVDAFRKVLALLPSEGKDCIFIDDNPKNVENANAVGIDGIHFLNAEQLREELRKRKIIS